MVPFGMRLWLGLGVLVAAACGDSATSGGGADETGSETSTTGGSEGTNASPTESSSDGITTGEDDTEDTAICVLAPSGGGLGFCDYPPSTTTGAEEPPGEIVFVRWTGSESDLMVVPAAGGVAVALTTEPGRDESPSFSGDGSRIAFSSTRDGNAEIYVMDADGGNAQRLTQDPEADVWPVFSPAGTQIAFVHGVPSSTLRVVGVDGTGLTEVAGAFGRSPTWSPEGSALAYWGNAAGNDDVWRVSIDGQGALNLTMDPASDTAPAWSPEGDRIVFVSDRSGNDDLYLTDPTGGSLASLFASAYDDTHPAWSPAGSEVAYLQHPDGAPAQLWTVDVDGRRSVPLSPPDLDVRSFDFSPDGQWLVFAADEAGRSSLWIVDREGTRLRRLTEAEGVDDVEPVWRPEP